MSSQLPPLHSLRAFAAFVQHGSVADAADALGLTPGAVNFQIHALQSFLDLELVHRVGKHLLLTEVGRQYGYQVRQAMDDLHHATHTARKQRHTRPRAQPVRVSLLPSFAQGWLLPRLPYFFKAHPSTQLVLHTSVDYVNFEQHGIDCAIRFGHGAWPHVHSSKLLDDSLVLIGAPQLVGTTPLASLKQAFALPVLNASENWTRWLSTLTPSANMPARPLSRAEFNDSTQLIEAVRLGMGIALTRRSIVQPLLDRGELVLAMQHECPHPSSYYIVRPMRQPLQPGLGAFINWMEAQAADQASQCFNHSSNA